MLATSAMFRSTPGSTPSAPAALSGTSSFGAVLSPTVSPPAFPSLPTSLLSGRRSSRRFAVPQFAPPVDGGEDGGLAGGQSSLLSPRAPSIPSSSPSLTSSTASLAVKGSSAVLTSSSAAPFRVLPTRKDEGSSGQRHSLIELRVQGSGEERQVEAVKSAVSGRRAARYRTWQVGQSPVSPQPLTSTVAAEQPDSREGSGSSSLHPPVQAAPPPAGSTPSSPFILTFPSTAQSTMTVELSPLSPSTPQLQPSMPTLSLAAPAAFSSPYAAGNSPADTASIPSLPPRSPSSAASPLAPFVPSAPQRPEPSHAASRRRSSLPLPMSSSSTSQAVSTPPLSPTAWTSSPKAGTPTSASASVHHRLRGMADSAWSRSTVDRFGHSLVKGKSPLVDDPNAWGLDETPSKHSPRAQTPLPPPPPLPAEPEPAPRPLPTSSFALPHRRRSRRASLVEPASQASVERPVRERPETSMRTARQRRQAAAVLRAAEAEMKPWGHWSQPGVRDGEEAKHPFPHRTHLFTDCQLRRQECGDRSCAKHGGGQREESSEEEVEGQAERGRKEVGVSEEEKEEATYAEAEVHNMTVVRLRGAGTAALLAAFSKATPAYAALSKLSPIATASSSVLPDPFDQVGLEDDSQDAVHL